MPQISNRQFTDVITPTEDGMRNTSPTRKRLFWGEIPRLRVGLVFAFVWLCLFAVHSIAEERSTRLLKAGYLQVTAPPTIALQMREAGLNAVWLKLVNFRPDGGDELSLRRIERWTKICAENDMQLWPVVNFCGSKNETEFSPNFRREINVAGIEQIHTPCPIDEAYWRKVVFPRFVKVAELSKTYSALAGMVLDSEMYFADHAAYSAPCFCAACERGAGSRKPQALLAWQRREVERICRDLEQQVHQISPKFQFAVMHLEEPYPFHEGLALGLGTADVPVVCAAERTYSLGYTSEVDDTRQRFDQLKAHVSYLGGLSLTSFPTSQVAPQLYALGNHGDGFWLYTVGSLIAPNEEVPPIYRLTEPQPLYWSAFREASDELDRFTKSKGTHVSRLVARLEPPEIRVTLSKRVLEPISPALPKLPLAGEETHLRRLNSFFVNLERGEDLRMSSRAFVLREDQTEPSLKVLDPEGREVAVRPIRFTIGDEIHFTATESGTHRVIINMALNSCVLTISNPHAVYFAGRHQRLKVFEHMRPMYFVVDPGQNIKVDVLVETQTEAVRVQLRNPLGKIAADKLVSGSDSVLAENLPGVWSVSISSSNDKPLHGVQIGLSPPLAPYLADAPERLLRDKR